MNKKLKVVSSVALAGMLALNTIAPVLATDTKTTSDGTKILSVHETWFNNTRVVPVVLAKFGDALTVKELRDTFDNISRVKGVSTLTDTAKLATGDTFVANGKTYTVVIYGDVNKDGTVNVSDATTLMRAIANPETNSLDDFQRTAANVRNTGTPKGTPTVSDVTNIMKFLATDAQVVTSLPKDEAEETQEQGNVKVSIHDNNIINADDLNPDKDFFATIKLDKALTKETTVKLVVNETSTSEKEISKKFKRYDNEEFDNLKISTKVVEASILLDQEKIGALKDGEYTAKLVDVKTNAVMSTFKFEKRTENIPTAIEVSTVRTNSMNASLSLKAAVETDKLGTDIAKVHYVVLPYGTVSNVVYKYDGQNRENSSLTKAVMLDILDDEDNDNKFTYNLGDENSTRTATIKTLEVSNNTLSNATIASDLQNDKAYVVYFLAENQYGSTSYDKQEATIAMSSSVAKLEAPKSVTAPDLSDDDTQNNNFTVEFSSTKDYKDLESTDATKTLNGKELVAVLYKDGVAVAEKKYTIILNGTPNDGEIVLKDYKLSGINFNNEMAANGSGEYTVKASLSADEKGEGWSASDAVESNAVEMKALETVKDAKFEVLYDGIFELSWKDNQNSEDDVAAYEIRLEALKNGVWSEPDSEVTIYGDDITRTKAVRISNLTEDVKYRAVITVKAKGDVAGLVDSAEYITDEFMALPTFSTATAKATGTSTIRINITDFNKEVKSYDDVHYNVSIYQANLDENEALYDGKKKTSYTLLSEKSLTNVPVITVRENNADVYYLEITDLTPYAEIEGATASDATYYEGAYAFVVEAEVEGVKVESNYITSADNSGYVKTNISMPEIKELTVAKKGTQTKPSGKYIYAYTNGNINVNGTIISSSDLNNKYPEILTKIANMLSNEALAEGDVVTLEGEDKLTVTLGDKSTTRTFDANLEDLTVVLKAADNKTYTLVSDDKKYAEYVTLEGAGEFVIDEFYAENEIVVSTGVLAVTNSTTNAKAKEVIIKNGSTPVVNGVKIEEDSSTGLDLTVMLYADNVNHMNVIGIKGVSGKEHILTLDNVTDSDKLIVFYGKPTNEFVEAVTLKANKGKLKVSTDGVIAVNADIVAIINNQSSEDVIDLTDEYLLGNKHIQVTDESYARVRFTVDEDIRTGKNNENFKTLWDAWKTYYNEHLGRRMQYKYPTFKVKAYESADIAEGKDGEDLLLLTDLNESTMDKAQVLTAFIQQFVPVEREAQITFLNETDIEIKFEKDTDFRTKDGYIEIGGVQQATEKN